MDKNEVKLVERFREQQKSIELKTAALQKAKKDLAQVMEVLVDRTDKYNRLRDRNREIKYVSDGMKRMVIQYKEEKEENFDTYELQVYNY